MSESNRIQEPDNALPALALADLPPALREACARAGWAELMPVQSRAIPYVFAGRDLMIQSRTGSGKTGAFLLPLLERLDRSRNATQALILVPTRELALQVSTEAELLAGGSGIRTVAVYGGTRYKAQLDAFREGAHIVIGTPGRVLDHLLRRSLTLEALSVLVFDEADRMLSMGFLPDMHRVKSYLPRHRVNGYMFSATFPFNVMRLAGEFLDHPETLSLSRDHVHVTDTEHILVEAPGMMRERCLVRLLEIENPQSALIFCNTKQSVGFLTEVLRRFGFDADELSSDLPQRAREQVLARVRAGRLRFLVATDVAARGIDIPDLSHVIQYEPPEDPEAYVHRAGRTGRAGAQGTAMTLATGIEELQIKGIGKRFDIEFVRRGMPTDEEVETVVGQRVTALLEQRLRDLGQVERERVDRFLPLARSLAEAGSEAALLAMLLDDSYVASLHAPVDAGAADTAPAREEQRPREGREPRRRGQGRRRRR